jgi:hypothetical protein
LKENNEIKIKNKEKKKNKGLNWKKKKKSLFDYMIGYLYNDTQVF